MHNFISYLKNVRAELRHVVWPSTKQALIHTSLIIVVSVFAALYIGLLDYLFTSGAGSLIGQ